MATSFDFDFRHRRPAGSLGRAVEQVWYARGTVPYARERIAPTGSTVAVLVLGDPILQTANDGAGPTLRATTGFLVGPHDRPVVNEPTGETHAVGVVTTSVGCEAVLGIRPARHRGRVDDLLSVWARAGGLRNRLLQLDDPEAMLDCVIDVLAADLDLGLAAFDRCERAVGLLEEDPTRPITAVAAALHVSAAQLTRDVSRVVGTSPRVLARLLRVRRLLEAIEGHHAPPWAELAAELGWYDQSHLIRDFRRHTGVAPSEYLAAQRMWTPQQDIGTAGFVPET